MKYVIARNASNRPTLQHAIRGYRSEETVCGFRVAGWTRIFGDMPLGEMLCLKCRKATAATNVISIKRRKTA